MTACLCGCVRVEQNLVLNGDGTGTLRFVYSVKDADLKRMSEVAAQMAAIDPSLAPTDVDWLTAFDESVIRSEWSKHQRAGVELTSVQTSLADGWRSMTADIRFDSLQQLFDCGMIKDCHIALTRGPSGQYGYQQSVDLKEASQSLPGGMDLKTLKPVFAMVMKDFKATFRVEVPGKIVRSNGDREEGRAAIWELNGEQEDLMERLQALDLRVMFMGEKLKLADASSQQ